MASVSVGRYTTDRGRVRFRVRYRLGGRETRTIHGGSFETKRDALARKRYIEGELSALRVPDVHALAAASTGETVGELVARWQASRIDVAGSTRVQHRVAVGRLSDGIRALPAASLTPADVAALVAVLAPDYARESIRKTLAALAMALDFGGVSPNPARDRVVVKLPREERDVHEPPTAEHVAAVVRAVKPSYRLPLLVLDDTGCRVGELVTLRWGDVDEPAGRWRIAPLHEKTRRGRWVTVSRTLFAAVLALKPREDREAGERVFAGVTDAQLRMAIGRACRATGVPVFGPHDFRRRRVTLLHYRGVPWRDIGDHVGQTNIATTANVYTLSMSDRREVAYGDLLAAV